MGEGRCATAIALGTFMGGWRIIDTLGKKVTGDITPPQGFSAEASGATLILGSSYFGYPLSTTQVVSGAVVGSGIGRGESEVNWAIAGRMGIAWVLTIPGAATVAAIAYGIVDVLGDTAGPIVVGALRDRRARSRCSSRRAARTRHDGAQRAQGRDPGAGMISPSSSPGATSARSCSSGWSAASASSSPGASCCWDSSARKRSAPEPRQGTVASYGALALAGGACTVALLVLGLWAITQK